MWTRGGNRWACFSHSSCLFSNFGAGEMARNEAGKTPEIDGRYWIPTGGTAVVTLAPPAGKLRSIIFPLRWLIYFQDCADVQRADVPTRLRSCRRWITVSHVTTSLHPQSQQYYRNETGSTSLPPLLFVASNHGSTGASAVWTATVTEDFRCPWKLKRE